MKKLFLSLFFFIFISSTLLTSYLVFFGFETSRFNDRISEVIKKSDKNINLKFEKVKLTLNIKKIRIYLELIKPELYYLNNQIPLKSIKADMDVLSLIKDEKKINQILLNTKYIDFKSIKPIIIKSKPGNLKSILLNNVKKSKFRIDAQLRFNEGLKLDKDSLFNGEVKETNLEIGSKYSFNNIKFNFVYKNKLLKINKLDGNLEDLKFYESSLDYDFENNHELNGEINSKINSSGNKINKIFSLAGFNLKNLSFLSFKASAKGVFNLKLDKTLAVKKSKFSGEVLIDEIITNLNKEKQSRILVKSLKKVHIKDSIIKIKHDNKESNIEVKSKVKIADKFFNLDFLQNNKVNKFEFSFNKENPIKFPLINHSKNYDKSILNGNYTINKNKEINLKDLKYQGDEDFFKIKNVILDKNFNLLNFSKVEVLTKTDGKLNNKFTILNNLSQNKIEIKGKVFDGKYLSEELSSTNEGNFFKNISKNIEIDLEKLLTDTDFPLNNFRLIGAIKSGKFEKISGKSEFSDGRYLDVLLKKENNSNFKNLEIYSDIARPIINSYKFFDGLSQGSLVFESRFDDKNSTALLQVNDFKLINAPAFAKLLTLADFKGLTDALRGEGISFDTLIIKYTTDSKVMTIQEIFMIGPSISILIEGYVEKQSGLISLRGTLVPAKTLNAMLSKIPLVGNILVGKKDGEGLFGVSFKIKGLKDNLKTTVNPVKTLTPRFITRALEGLKKKSQTK